MTLESAGQLVDQALIDQLKAQYGLDQPIYVQYFKWVAGMTRGEFGQSLTWKTPVKELIWERVGMSNSSRRPMYSSMRKNSSESYPETLPRRHKDTKRTKMVQITLVPFATWYLLNNPG